MAFLVGLTGGLASGKSTVAKRLGQAGFAVVDADALVAQMYAPHEEGARAVAELFGSNALTPDGAVDRAKVGAIVFRDAHARARLEAAIHPLVRERFQRLAATLGPNDVAVHEATLLIEAGYGPMFHFVVTVEAPEPLRLARAIARGLSEADARARLAAQGDGARRRKGAHRILENRADLAALEAQTDALAADLRRLAKAASQP